MTESTSGNRWEPGTDASAEPSTEATGQTTAVLPESTDASPTYAPVPAGDPTGAPASDLWRRPSRSTTITAGVGAAALLVGGLIGFGIGHAQGDDSPTPGFGPRQGFRGQPPQGDFDGGSSDQQFGQQGQQFGQPPSFQEGQSGSQTVPGTPS